jgi:hypothetical protein
MRLLADDCNPFGREPNKLVPTKVECCVENEVYKEKIGDGTAQTV